MVNRRESTVVVIAPCRLPSCLCRAAGSDAAGAGGRWPPAGEFAGGCCDKHRAGSDRAIPGGRSSFVVVERGVASAPDDAGIALRIVGPGSFAAAAPYPTRFASRYWGVHRPMRTDGGGLPRRCVGEEDADHVEDAHPLASVVLSRTVCAPATPVGDIDQPGRGVGFPAQDYGQC